MHLPGVRERDVYAKQQEVEARLVAAGLFECELLPCPSSAHIVLTTRRKAGVSKRDSYTG
jgi:hypothetical protein